MLTVLTAPMGKVVKMIHHSECTDKIFLVVISTVNRNVTFLTVAGKYIFAVNSNAFNLQVFKVTHARIDPKQRYSSIFAFGKAHGWVNTAKQNIGF